MVWNDLLNPRRVRDLHKGLTEDEPKDKDPRSEFQRDYDRCLFSTPVRRLQDKAQVFPLEINDSVRTRLTHSLEVSNVAKGIAERIGNRLIEKGKIAEEQKQNMVCIAGTCGLIHDLGNPPFGHSGEDSMRSWFEKKIEEDKIKLPDGPQKNDFLNFEGNAQTIRLVSKLQMLGDFSGLNLTSGTMATTRKYLSSSTEIDGEKGQQYKKLGYFQSEKSLIEKVEQTTGTSGKRHPVTYMVEAADDIVYSIIDLEDALKKRVLDWEFIRKELAPLIPDLINMAEENVYNRAVEQGFQPRNGQTTNGDENIHKDTDFEELNGQTLSEARMSILRTSLIGHNIRYVVEEFIEKYDDIMKGKYNGELVQHEKIIKIIKKCKEVARNIVFNSPAILKLEIMGRNIIHGLMDHFWLGIKHYPYDDKKIKKLPFNFKVYSLLSDNYKKVFEYKFNDLEGLSCEYIKLQLLADYICGMTDSFAKELHREVYNG
ncbi:MAG: dNTP triphosphohydrolase [Cyclobacteriaceae bacterium]|nr:dNTP triphosphohydrolase [Cyclobacteriaceae bacterium]